MIAYSRERVARFLAAIREGQPVTRASEVIGVDRTTVYYWLRHRPAFRRAFIDVKVSALLAQNVSTPVDTTVALDLDPLS